MHDAGIYCSCGQSHRVQKTRWEVATDTCVTPGEPLWAHTACMDPVALRWEEAQTVPFISLFTCCYPKSTGTEVVSLWWKMCEILLKSMRKTCSKHGLNGPFSDYVKFVCSWLFLSQIPFLYSPAFDRPIFMVLHYFDCFNSSIFSFFA